MNYKMNVTICSPKDETKVRTMELDVEFSYDEKTYGNGHYLYIGNGSFEFYLDIRYDSTFNKNKKTAYLRKWAKNYWSGENGAYKVKTIKIERA